MRGGSLTKEQEEEALRLWRDEGLGAGSIGIKLRVKASQVESMLRRHGLHRTMKEAHSLVKWEQFGKRKNRV